MNDYITFVSIALFAVYEQRHKGWTYFFGALSGKYAIPSKGGTTSSTTTTKSTTNPTGNPVVASGISP